MPPERQSATNGAQRKGVIHYSLHDRLILLGASNLTRALPYLLHELSSSNAAGDRHIFIAAGHGRSYGIDSTVLGRTLPGIIHCGLWDALAHERFSPTAAARTCALITDVGNDIMYHRTPCEIIGWIGNCVESLRAVNASICITSIPMDRIRRMSRREYLVARRLLFPRNTLSFEVAMARAESLDGRLRTLAAERGLPIVDLPDTWYGIDPIHIRRRFFDEAWPRILEPWGRPAQEDPAEVSIRMRIAARMARSQRMRMFGRTIRRAQPSLRLGRSTFVSLF